VSVVRRRLQPDRPSGESFIVTRDKGYVLDTRRVGLDLADLRRLVRGLDAHPPTDPERSRIHQQILDLATDLPFPEDEDADWARVARDDVRAATLGALLHLSAAACTGDPARALRLAQEAITLDPIVEQSYRAAINACRALGRPDEALRWYERCRQVLDDDLGIGPSAETRQLHLAVLRSRGLTEEPATATAAPVIPAPPVNPAPVTPAPPVTAGPAGVTAPPVPSAPGATALPPATEPARPAAPAADGEPQFVGRRAELDLLLHRSPVPVVHLVGPPGAGKSAVLAELRRRAPGRVGIGHGPTGADATGALRLTWLRTALSQLPVRTDALAAVDAAILQQRPLTLDELEVLAVSLDTSTQVVLAIDDAAELDATSVAELNWLGRRCALLNVVLTYRYPSAVVGRPLAALGTPMVLRLSPLADEDLDPLGDPDLGERTGGIPALVGAAHRVPEVAEEVAMQIARSRTQWMPEAAWEVLRLSAALGSLRVGELATLTGRPVSELLTSVDQLIHAHLLTEGPDGDLRHRSNLIRDAVARQVSSASGRHLRERLAAGAE
jgi:DNA-binding SARP family transcriptional activator